MTLGIHRTVEHVGRRRCKARGHPALAMRASLLARTVARIWSLHMRLRRLLQMTTLPGVGSIISSAVESAIGLGTNSSRAETMRLGSASSRDSDPIVVCSSACGAFGRHADLSAWSWRDFGSLAPLLKSSVPILSADHATPPCHGRSGRTARYRGRKVAAPAAPIKPRDLGTAGARACPEGGHPANGGDSRRRYRPE